jgi:hypothetical protein
MTGSTLEPGISGTAPRAVVHLPNLSRSVENRPPRKENLRTFLSAGVGPAQLGLFVGAIDEMRNAAGGEVLDIAWHEPGALAMIILARRDGEATPRNYGCGARARNVGRAVHVIQDGTEY